MSLTRAAPTFDVIRCDRLLEEAGIDLLLASSRVNVGYLSGCMTHIWNWNFPYAFEMEQDYDHAVDYLLFVGIPRGAIHSSFLVTYFHHVETSRGQTWIDDIRGAGRPGYVPRDGLRSILLEPPTAASHIDRVVEAVNDLGLAGASVGVELRRIPESVFRELRNRLPRASFVDATPVLDRMRTVKTSTEIEKLRKAYSICAGAFTDVFFKELRAGAPVYGVFVDAVEHLYRQRATLLFSHFFFGSGHARGPAGEPPPYNFPQDRSLKKGEMGSVDFGVAYGGYFSDINRPIVVGTEPTPEQSRAHRAVMDARQAILEATAPGVKASDLYSIGAAALDEFDYGPALTMMGHGIGLKIHERPWLQPDSADVLEPGMIFSVEPLIEVPGLTLICVEDAIVVTESGCEPLCELSTDIHVTR